MISFSTASCYNTKNILLDTGGSTPMSQLQANHFSHITLRPYTPKTVKKSAFFSMKPSTLSMQKTTPASSWMYGLPRPSLCPQRSSGNRYCYFTLRETGSICGKCDSYHTCLHHCKTIFRGPWICCKKRATGRTTGNPADQLCNGKTDFTLDYYQKLNDVRWKTPKKSKKYNLSTCPFHSLQRLYFYLYLLLNQYSIIFRSAFLRICLP